MRFVGLIALTLAGCASGSPAAPDAADLPPDAVAPIDADQSDCDPLTPAVDPPQTWYADSDGDAHGDPAASMVACTAPADHVGLGDDCDDASAFAYPGLAETCDGLDNDCSPATTEVCPSGCVVRVRADDQRRYLFCTTTTSWGVSSATCTGQSFRLARADDATENAWIRTTGNEALGANDFWFGASDSTTEGAWLWADATQFWTGGSGGATVGGLYANWDPGEPNDDGTEDCGEVKPDGQWNDAPCTDAQRFACERY